MCQKFLQSKFSRSKLVKYNLKPVPLSLKMSKSVTCFLCSKLVMIDNLSDHLLLSEVECTKCGEVFKTCQSFQVWTVEHAMGNSTCVHSLEYPNDPLKVLQRHLSCHYTGSLVVENTSDLDERLSVYLGKLRTLEHKLPWKQAVMQHKMGTKGLTEGSVQPPKDFISPPGKELSSITGSPMIYHREALQSSQIDSLLIDSDITHLENGSEFDKSIVTRIEDGVKFDKVTTNCLSTQSTKSPSSQTLKALDLQPTKKKRRCRKCLGLKEGNALSGGDQPFQYAGLPPDGFYYVSSHAIEECPNCYAVLCPSWFTVNVSTFLITGECSECNLKLYIDPNLNKLGPGMCSSAK